MSDDHDHDDDEEPTAAPDAVDDAMDAAAIQEALQSAIDGGRKVQIVRGALAQSTWNGFPLLLADDLVLVRTLRDFAFDGFAILCLRDITAVRAGDVERFFERVIRAEGLDKNLPPPKPILLRSLRNALESVRAHYRYAIIECESTDEDAFFLGEITRVDDEQVHLRYVHVDGTRDSDPTPIDLDAVTLVRFDELYVNLYGRYSLDAHHH